MLKLTDEARAKIKQRLNAYCDSETDCYDSVTGREKCIFAYEDCDFDDMEDVKLLKCYHKWLDMIIHENLLGEEE